MNERTVEDRLLEEYFALLPSAMRVLEELEAKVRYALLPLSKNLDNHERLVVTSRIKDCESALGALRRRQEALTFDPDRADSFSLTALNDLAGVRVLALPRNRLMEVKGNLSQQFSSWTSDPIRTADESGEALAFKYHGYCSRSSKIHVELQIVPMLIGLFWEVEHSAIYKSSPHLKSVVESFDNARTMSTRPSRPLRTTSSD